MGLLDCSTAAVSSDEPSMTPLLPCALCAARMAVMSKPPENFPLSPLMTMPRTARCACASRSTRSRSCRRLTARALR